MKYAILILLGAASFFVVDWLGAQSVADAPLVLWPGDGPGSMMRAALGAVAFGFAALLVGSFLLLPFRPKKRRKKYPSSLGELDEYTGYLP